MYISSSFINNTARGEGRRGGEEGREVMGWRGDTGDTSDQGLSVISPSKHKDEVCRILHETLL